MSVATCKAITQSGERCKVKPNSSGYCHIHQRILEEQAERQRIESLNFAIPSRRFSERRGLKPVREVLQSESMSRELRHSLWNVLSAAFFRSYSLDRYPYGYYGDKNIDNFCSYIWSEYFKNPLDELPKSSSHQVAFFLRYFQESEWYEVYDLLEITLNYFESPALVDKINNVLEAELSAYRFVGGVFAEITSEQEIEILEEVLEDPDFPAVKSHLNRALALMSHRTNPDYRNSIKESISAVESMAKAITGKPGATLTDALRNLEVTNKLHPALKESFLKLYGYTSDEGGIRHAMLKEPNLDASDAKFFLLSCSSFINYLKSKT